MFKSLVVSALLAGGTWGGFAAGSGQLPALPSAPAVSAPAAAAPSSLPTVQALAPVATCGQAQARRNAAAQASKTAEPSSGAAAPSTSPEAPAPAPAGTGGVNLNTATADELEALPGIGKATAARIIASRPIAQVEDVKAMPGVTSPNYALLAPRVTV